MSTPKLSIVIPCYNEEDIFHYCLENVKKLLVELIDSQEVAPSSYILFVDDGSTDQTWDLILKSTQNEPLVKGIKLASNVGHQKALFAGLSHVNSDVSVTLDADLQDDIQVIRTMLLDIKKGSDVVFGVRSSRDSDRWFKKTSAQLFYKLLSFLRIHHVENHADFRMMTTKVTKALLAHRESNLYLRGLIRQIGFSSSIVEYARNERSYGTSKYPLKRMISLALDAITSHSIVPLRVITCIGLVISCVSFLAGIHAIYVKLTGDAVDGWASLITSIYFIGGVQLMSLGVIGEYVGRTYVESKKRPGFFIDKEAD